MKKKLLFALLLTPALLLAACGGSDSTPTPTSTPTPSVLPDPTQPAEEEIQYSDAKMVTNQFVENNGRVAEEKVNTRGLGGNSVSNVDYDYSYAAYGLVITKVNGKIGFYSLLHGKAFIGTRYVEAWTSYSVRYADGVGFLLAVRYENKLSIYDGFFNLLFEDGEQVTNFTYNNYNSHTYYINGKTYLVLNVDRGNLFDDVERVFEYAENGEARQISYLPSEEPQPVIDDYIEPEVNKLLTVGWNDLSAYGMDGYYLFLSANGMATTFKRSGESYDEVVSFNIDSRRTAELLVGGNIYYQRRYALPEDATSYDFYDNGNKYSLETYEVNVLNGELKKHNYKIVFSNVVMLNNNNGEKTYCALTYRNIVTGRVLGSPITRIVDKNFVFYDDVSNLNVQAMIKLANGNYFDTANKVLYNNKLQVITDLSNVNGYYNEEKAMFVGNIDGKYGLVDINGVVATKFDYTNIYLNDIEDNYVIATKNNDVYRVSLYSKSDFQLGTNLRKIDENFFSYVSGSYRYYVTSSDTLCYVPTLDNFQENRLTYLGEHYVYYLYSAQASAAYMVKYNEFTLADFTPIDSDTSYVPNGSEFAEAQGLKVGENAVHKLNNTNNAYLRFTPSKDGYYNFEGENEFTLTVYVYNENNESYQNISNTVYNTYGVHYLLDKDVTYYFAFAQYTESQLFNLKITLEDGVNSEYPLIYKAENLSSLVIAPHDGVLTNRYFVRFYAEESGYYRVEKVGTGLDIESVILNDNDVTEDGFGVAANSYVELEINFADSVASNQTIRVVNDSSLLPAGSSVEKAVRLPFGLSYDDASSFSLLKLDGVVDYGYFRYDFVEPGQYSLFAQGNNYRVFNYRVYNADGTTYYNSSSNANSINVNITAPEAGSYLILSCSLVSGVGMETIYAYLYGNEGKVIERPYALSLGQHLYNSSYNTYYQYELPHNGQFEISVKDGQGEPSSVQYLSNGQFVTIEDGEKLAGSTEPYIFKVQYATERVINFKASVEESEVTALTLEAENNVSLKAKEEKFYKFTNEGEEPVEIYFSSESNLLAKFVSGEEFAFGTAVNSRNSHINVAAGETVLLTVRTLEDIETTFVVTETPVVGQFEIVLNHDGTYGWLEEDGMYTSNNVGIHGTSASMVVYIYSDGVFSFQYMSSGESGCDYLFVQLNGSTILNCSNNGTNSSFYNSEVEVHEGDMLVFTFRKDGSVNSGLDCAKITSLNLQ